MPYIDYEKKQASARKSHFKRKYGITQEEYDELLLNQNGVCAVCKEKCWRRLCVDHNHATGEIRGLLCSSCNSMLGWSKDTPSILEEGAKYLRSYGGVDSRTMLSSV